MKNIHYYDTETNNVNQAYHVRHDKCMSDLKDPSPNARQLRQALGENVTAEKNDEPPPPECTVITQTTLFNRTITVHIPIICDHKYCGLTFKKCEQ